MLHYRFVTLLSVVFCVQILLAQGFRIKGIVVDESTRSPLTGATVHIRKVNIGVATDIDGNYELKNLPPDTYIVSTSYIGYKIQQKEIVIKDSSLVVNFALESSPSLMNEVVVTGTGTKHYLKDTPVQTEVITGRALKEYAGRDIEDVLGGLSSSFSFTQNDMGSNIQLNGLKNDYILILIDGKRMNGDVGGQNDLSRININNIERIEIVKGAVSSLYGSDAIGGVINFISKKDSDKISITSSTRIGEHEDTNQNNSISIGHDKWQSTTSFALKHTHGWKNTSQEWYRGRLIENSVTKTINRSTNYTVAENLTYKVNKNLDLSANASFYEKWTSRPTGIPLWRLNDFYYRSQTYGMGSKYKLGNHNFISFDSSFDRYDYYYDYTSREYTDYFDDEDNRVIYYPGDRILQSSQRKILNNLKSVFYLGEHHTFSVGAEHVWDKLVSPYRLEGDKATFYSTSVYAQDEWNITDKLNVTGGVRFGQHRAFGQTVTPKISGMYKLGDFNLRATYSNGFKAPTIKELYYHYYATLMSKYKAYYGNTDLKPQKSDYVAISGEYHRPKFKASITAFHNNIRNMISLESTTTSYEDKLLLVEETMRYVNLAKGRTYGIDMTFEANLPLNIRVGGGYSYLDAKAQRTDDETAEDYMKYTYINATSRHNATFRTSWSNAWKKYELGIAINGRYQSKRYHTSDGNTKPYQIWRLNTSHGLLDKKKIKLDMNAGIDNIFNYIDRTPFGHNRGTTSPGRNIYVSVNVKFHNKNN